MPQRRDRDEVLAEELERVADALRAGEAVVHGYRVRSDPEPHRTGGVAYPGGWFEFRIEPDEGADRDCDDRSTGTAAAGADAGTQE